MPSFDMEYRLVKDKEKDNYIQIYREEDSELLGSIIFGRKWLVFRQVSLRLDDTVLSTTNGLLRRRHWSWDNRSVDFRAKMLGRKVKISIGEEQFDAVQFERGKMELSHIKTKRTGLVIDPSQFSDRSMVLVQYFERFDLETALLVSALILDQYRIW